MNRILKRAASTATGLFVTSLIGLGRAQAQQPADPAPQLPPPGPNAPPAQPQYYPQQQQYPQQQYPQQQYPQQQYPQQQYPQQQYPQQQQGYYAQPIPPPPPRVEYQEPEVPVHAPKYSLYAGMRLSYMGFGGSWYAISDQQDETTGNLVKQGPAFEFDVGAPLGRHYIPFVFVEHAFLGAGHNFEGISASATSDLYGVGLRSVSGDVDSVGLVTEITIGRRTVAVSSGNTTYSLSSIEFLKFGLGAEIRISTLFTLSPLAFIGTGQMNDSNGDVTYANGNHPVYTQGEPVRASQTYVVIGIGVGAHFDIFGK